MKRCPSTHLFLLLLLLFVASNASAQARYTLPRFEVLAQHRVQQIEVFEQRINPITQWDERLAPDETDQRLGEKQLIARYHIGPNGWVDSVSRWDTTGTWIDQTRVQYDESGNIAHIHVDDTSGRDAVVQLFHYADTGMRYERRAKGKWTRKARMDAAGLLLVDHVRTARDSGVYRYDEALKTLTNIAYRDGALAYDREMRYLFKDGVPDSLYLKYDYYLPAFETYLVAGVDPHVEGTVDILSNGQAVVPEHSPLYGVIETGFAFGQHRTLPNLPKPFFYEWFNVDSLVHDAPIWPYFISPNDIKRSYFEISYKH